MLPIGLPMAWGLLVRVVKSLGKMPKNSLQAIMTKQTVGWIERLRRGPDEVLLLEAEALSKFNSEVLAVNPPATAVRVERRSKYASCELKIRYPPRPTAWDCRIMASIQVINQPKQQSGQDSVAQVYDAVRNLREGRNPALLRRVPA
jgi:hypothetical protein